MEPIERVREYLKGLPVSLEIIEFAPGETRDCDMAGKALGVSPAQIAKTLLFIGKKTNAMVVTCGDRKVDSKKLKNHFGGRFRFARAEEVEDLTGFSPGGVCPFGLDGDIPFIIDPSIKRFDVVYSAAGNDASAVPVTFEQLLEITGGIGLDVSLDGE